MSTFATRASPTTISPFVSTLTSNPTQQQPNNQVDKLEKAARANVQGTFKHVQVDIGSVSFARSFVTSQLYSMCLSFGVQSRCRLNSVAAAPLSVCRRFHKPLLDTSHNIAP
jgi:hypothetical protein